MKKKISIFLVGLFAVILTMAMPAKAAESQVVVSGTGTVKKDQEVNITVDVKNMSKMFTAIIDFNYDKDLLLVEDISYNKELVGDTRYMVDSNGITGTSARFGFSYIRPLTGFDGDSNFVTIKAKALKDGEIKLTRKNFKIQLVTRIDEGKVDYIQYKLPGEIKEDPSQDDVINSGDVVIDDIYKPIVDDGSDDRVVIKKELISNDNLKAEASNSKEDKTGSDKDDATAKDEGSKDGTTTSENSEEVAGNRKDEKSNTILYVLGGVVVIVAAAGGVIYFKKKKNNNNNDEINQ